jgi:hypothetical protein
MPIHRRRATSGGVPPTSAPAQHPSQMAARRTQYRMAAAHSVSRTAAGKQAGGEQRTACEMRAARKAGTQPRLSAVAVPTPLPTAGSRGRRWSRARQSAFEDQLPAGWAGAGGRRAARTRQLEGRPHQAEEGRVDGRRQAGDVGRQLLSGVPPLLRLAAAARAGETTQAGMSRRRTRDAGARGSMPIAPAQQRKGWQRLRHG